MSARDVKYSRDLLQLPGHCLTGHLDVGHISEHSRLLLEGSKMGTWAQAWNLEKRLIVSFLDRKPEVQLFWGLDMDRQEFTLLDF